MEEDEGIRKHWNMGVQTRESLLVHDEAACFSDLISSLMWPTEHIKSLYLRAPVYAQLTPDARK